jgi:hypothetical protein
MKDHGFGGVSQGWERLDWPSAAAAENRRLQAFAAFWEGGCKHGALPPRRHLDPLKLAPTDLGWIVLSEREAPAVYRYRLFGTNLTRLIGRDLTGQTIDRLSMNGSAGPFLEMLEAVADQRAPIYLRGNIFWEGREYREFQQVTVPFADETGAPRYFGTLVHVLNPV